jgi:hypothetical protein
MYLKSNKQKNFCKKLFFVGFLKDNDENSRIHYSEAHGSADPDPDPHQNVMNPQHWS